jgi:hypothetical protein
MGSSLSDHTGGLNQIVSLQFEKEIGKVDLIINLNANPAPTSFFLLEDGTSHILLEDGVSKLGLET